ncbi:MAG: class I SAM-dependent methyltransferase [Candidatus Hodarchaeota archaeon]
MQVRDDSTATKQKFEDLVSQVISAPFSGWDFSYLDNFGGMPSDPLPWSYDRVVREHMKDAKVLLDMGTGGGEKLSEFQPLPPQTYATESYKPNVLLARGTLGFLGVEVVEVDEGVVQEQYSLPFEDTFFDLVINRHEAYESKEVFRVLKPKGTFITQQVGPPNIIELKSMLNEPGTLVSEEDDDWTLQTAVTRLEEAGFHILRSEEHVGISRFSDIRTVVYFAKAIPWDFPNFSLERCYEPLYEIYKRITTEGYFDTKNARFFILAKKNEV